MNRKPIGKKSRKGIKHSDEILDHNYLMEIDEVAKLLGKSPSTIRNWVAKREFPFIQVGNKNLFKRSSILNWINEKEFLP